MAKDAQRLSRDGKGSVTAQRIRECKSSLMLRVRAYCTARERKLQVIIKIKKLKLQNFQGIKSLEVEPDGKPLSVYGANGAGKTTLYNAFCWLLFGRPSTAEKNFTPQTVGTHNLEHTAEITLSLDDGLVSGATKLTLKKSYHETYKGKRGTKDKVFTGYTTDYFIDDVPVKESGYTAKVHSLCPVDTAKMLTRPKYFLEEMKVSDRRQVLMTVFGDMPDSEFISEDLAKILDGHSVEDCQKIQVATLKKLRERIEEIPARIDEAEVAKPEAGDVDKAMAGIDAISKEKAELEKRLASVDSTLDADLRKEKAEAEAELERARAEHLKAEAERLKAVEEPKRAKLKEIEEKKKELASLELSRITTISSIATDNQQREILLNKYHETEGKEWTGDTVCPTCGQGLPTEKIEETKKAFNLHKSEDLEQIKREGLEVKKSLEVLNAEKESLDVSIANANLELATLEAELKDLGNVETHDFEETDDYKALMQKIGDLAIRLSNCEAIVAGAKAEIRAEIIKKEEALKELNRIVVNAEVAKAQDARIKELETEQKSLAKKIETAEHGLYLCEEFYKRKTEALTERINGHFKSLSFRLFKEQVNGGLADDCEALIPCGGVDVPYKSANNASRINAGLELADTLGEAMGVILPVFIDNAEGVSEIQDTKGQQIRLYVSDKDKALRMEV